MGEHPDLQRSQPAGTRSTTPSRTLAILCHAKFLAVKEAAGKIAGPAGFMPEGLEVSQD